ncbi:acrosinacrosin-like [Podarcis lilfordi]|uniref:Acrosin n=2 Tax=Podarcis lilfordi TaxID=74358 RepID=A0AA35L094_9SAUR|nr:acrosinacrosin-like [Podarcis lilfordi]
MRWLVLSVLVLAAFQPTHNATVSNCDGICGRRPMASSHKLMRIMGGSNVLPGTWPWMVSIQTKVRGNVYFPSCGGSLIGPQWVLSAVHCFPKPKDQYKLVLGSNRIKKLGPEAEQRFIKRLVKHEKYDNQLNQGEVVFADIALLEMDEPVNCSDYIQPACLPDERMEVLTLSHCYVSGWGGLLPKDSTPPDIMQEGATSLYSRIQCGMRWGRRIPTQNVCAGHEEGTISICRGDSGGPLMCREERSERYWVIGVASFGPLYCGTAKIPSVFISTQYYLDWIQRTSKLQLSVPTHTPLLAQTQATTMRKPRTLPTAARPRPHRPPWVRPPQWGVRPPPQVQTTRSSFPPWMRENYFWGNRRPGRRTRYRPQQPGPRMAPRSQFADPPGYYPGSEDYYDLLVPSGEQD